MDDRLKNFFKRWPRLYNVLFYVIGPILATGVTSRKFVARFTESDRILHAGSGTKRLARNCINVDILPLEGVDVVADLVDLPFKDGEFDAVTCEHVLEHVERPWDAARELRRVTRPGGQIHIAVPFLIPWHPSPLDYTRWTMDGLRELFPDCEPLEQGVLAGPFSACTAFLSAFFATILSFGIRGLQSGLQYVFLLLFAPLKLLDLLFAHLPGAELCCGGVYVVLKTPQR